MTVTGSFNGHTTVWVYQDTLQPVDAGNPRPCPKCGKVPGPDGIDPCIHRIPGVTKACCGHGKFPPYVVLESGEIIMGADAVHLMEAWAK